MYESDLSRQREARTAYHLMVRAEKRGLRSSCRPPSPASDAWKSTQVLSPNQGMKAMNELPPNKTPDSVEVTENLGEWFVRVVRNGKATITLSKSNPMLARSQRGSDWAWAW